MADDGEPETVRSTQAYVRFRPVRMETVEDCLFVIDAQEFAIHLLNPTGRLVWAALEHAASVDDVATVLSGLYPKVSHRKLKRDVLAIFEELFDFKLIRPVPSSVYA